MKLTAQILFASLAFASPLSTNMAFAKEGVQEPTVKAWMDLMVQIGLNTKTLGDMAGGKTDFDATAAGAAQAALASAAATIAVAFKDKADDPVSETRPEVWMNWDGFEAKAKGLEDAASAMDVSSIDGVRAGMGDIAGACKACHSDFRAKK